MKLTKEQKMALLAKLLLDDDEKEISPEDKAIAEAEKKLAEAKAAKEAKTGKKEADPKVENKQVANNDEAEFKA